VNDDIKTQEVETTQEVDLNKPKKPKKAKRAYKIKRANSFLFWILRGLIGSIVKSKYKYRFLKKSSKGIKRPCLILSSHQTGYDQFSVGIGFKFGINYVASASIFRHGIKSSLMRNMTHPIPFAKGSSDPAAVKQMFSVIRQGGAVAMFPSGNRSFYGEECTLQPGLGKLAKRFKVPIVLVQLRGGYNTKPRWANKSNKGYNEGEVVRIVTVEEQQALTDAEVEKIIVDSIYINEYEWLQNREKKIIFKGKTKAECLERVLFYCPICKSTDGLYSHGNDFFCTKCDLKTMIDPYGFFAPTFSNLDKQTLKVIKSKKPKKRELVNLDPLPENFPKTILEWSKLQLDFVVNNDYSSFSDIPIHSDIGATLLAVDAGYREHIESEGNICLYNDRLKIGDTEFLLSDIKDMSVQSKNRIMLYTMNAEYAIDMQDRDNAMKYMITAYHLKNQISGTTNPQYGY